MIVHLAEDHDELAFDIASFGARKRVVIFTGAQGRAVDVGRKVAYSGDDAWVQGAAVGEVAT